MLDSNVCALWMLLGLVLFEWLYVEEFQQGKIVRFSFLLQPETVNYCIISYYKMHSDELCVSNTHSNIRAREHHTFSTVIHIIVVVVVIINIKITHQTISLHSLDDVMCAIRLQLNLIDIVLSNLDANDNVTYCCFLYFHWQSDLLYGKIG